ncbi:MAG: LAGLIDADG family homing endonuclease [Candidatus Diapherotrites archaeon]
MRRFVDLNPAEQRTVFEKFWGLRKEGFGYKRIIKQVKQEDNICLRLSTLSYWSNRDVELLGGQNWFEEKPSRELAYLIGVMFGDGSITHNAKKQEYVIQLESIDRDFAEKFSHCISIVLKKKRDYAVCEDKRGPIYATHTRSKQLYSFFKSIKEDFPKAKPFIEEYPAEFIQGLADSEGGPAISSKNTLRIRVGVAYSTNLELLEYVRSLLYSRFSIGAIVNLHKKAGITDSVINGRPITRTKNVYSLTINSHKGVEDFCFNIGFGIPRKQSRLKEALKILELLGSDSAATIWRERHLKTNKNSQEK